MTHKAGLQPVKAEEGEKKKKKEQEEGREAGHLERTDLVRVFSHGVQDTSAKGAVPELLAVAGML